jgi:hypothetical protein
MRTLITLTLLTLAVAGMAIKPLATLTGSKDWKAWKADTAWAWNGAWVGGMGTNAWRYAEIGDAKWANYRIDATLRIDTPATRRDPKTQAGGWVWSNYFNNADLGGYEAGLIFRKNGKDFYRLMFSTPFQEVVLWSTKGGILQVVPCALEVGKPVQVRIETVLELLTVTVDGKRLFSYADLTPTMSKAGSVGLGIQEGAASFSNVTVLPYAGPLPQLPAHKADFHIRDWKGLRWGWDGNEPIFYAANDCKGYDVKLVPGYKPQLEMYWHWLNYGDESFYADKLKAITVQEEGPRLTFTVDATGRAPYEWLGSRTRVTVSYDAAQSRYVYEHVSDLTLPEGKSLRINHPLEFTDPCVHGHVGSASPQTATWETPHPWSVYKHVTGALYKQPHNHYTWYPGWGNPAWQEAKGNFLALPDGYWALVGDPVANPLLTVHETNIKDPAFYTELCGWAYDVHMRVWPGGPKSSTLGPGTYTVKWQLSTVNGTQGDAWLKQATLLKCSDPEKKVLQYTAGIGHVETFSTVTKWAEPFYTYPLGDATLQDATVGHTDKTSLKIVGPHEATSCVGGSVYSDPVLENTRYEVSAWVKTLDARGEGPGLKFGGQVYVSRLTGTRDWQRIGFVCTPGQPLHTVNFSLFNSGSGTVWFDDFQIRPLKKDETPAAPIAPAPVPVAAADAAADRLFTIDATSDAKDPGRTLLDLSGHGNHLALAGTAAMTDDAGTRVLTTEADKGWASGGYFTFKAPQSFTIWVKPGKLTNDWNMVATGGAWNRTWMLFLYYKQAPYSVDLRVAGRRLFTDGCVPQDKWTHLAVTDDGKTLVLYVNGEKVKEDTSANAPWASVDGPLTLGTWHYYDSTRSGYTGSLANAAYWTVALDPAAVKALDAKGMK